MGKKILTIDDSKTVRAIISKHLSQFSVRMLEAENGEQGVVRARKGAPDLILLDYNMPVMDGYHTLVELKSDPNLKSIPVVMVTTETSKETVIKLLRLGLTDYIAKPFTRELLIEKVNSIVSLYDGDPPPLDAEKGAGSPESKAATAQKSPSVAEVSAKPAILVVDDKASVLQLLQEYIDDKYEVTTADSGQAALNAMEHKSFDFILLDLNMPDISGYDFLKQYHGGAKNGASGKKVIGMLLRSAQNDIRRASEAGLQVLFKPFTRAEVKSALDQASSSKKLRFLTTNGNVRILDCPGEKSSRFRIYAASLNSEISQEIDGMVDEHLNQLIIKLGEGFLSHKLVRRDFTSLLNHIGELHLSVRLVADSALSRDSLKKLPETANIPTDVSLECALGSIA